MAPAESWLAAGRVYDLTDFAETDPGFDQADFYEQIWQGAWWRGRMWFLPQAAAMQLVYYDREAYEQAGLVPPSLRWTWGEMGRDLAALEAARPATEMPWAFLDSSRDVLFAYAYNWNRHCPGRTAVACVEGLRPAEMAAALAWYHEMAGQPGAMPDLTQLTAAERDFRAINLLAMREVAVYVGRPVDFEPNLLRQPIGVVPIPGSDRFDGITPLWVEGSFISQHSQRPRAVWEWLKFLSYQNVRRQLRMVPARPSVAEESTYWTTLPRPLGEAMRAAFPFARPVKLDERELFSWELLAAVISGELTPEEASQVRPRLRWFW